MAIGARRKGGSPLKWLELSTTVPAELVEPLVELFNKNLVQPVAVEQGGFNPDEGEAPPTGTHVTLYGYLLLDSSATLKREHLDVGVRLLRLIHPMPPFSERTLEEEDWGKLWKSHFEVMHIGRHIVLRPSWQEYRAKKGEIVVELDPGLAFGTGYHPTTRTCLEELEAHLEEGMRVLDVGTGSGILAIVAAKLGASQVIALDIDPLAVKSTRQNARANSLGRKVRVYRGTLTRDSQRMGSFDLVLANLHARALCQIMGFMEPLLSSRGLLIASGIWDERRGEVDEALKGVSLKVIREHLVDHWLTLVATK